VEERHFAVEALVTVAHLRRLSRRRDASVAVRRVRVTVDGGPEVAPVLATGSAPRGQPFVDGGSGGFHLLNLYGAKCGTEFWLSGYFKPVTVTLRVRF